MAILEIKQMGEPVLKEKCAAVERIDRRVKRLLDDMAETMYAKEGIGIAAPQVGEAIRAVVIDIGKKRYELINPEITWQEGAVVDSEGCLSFPGVYGEVERAAKVRVEYLNRYGKERFMEAEGLLARCIQHEIDHLEGKLFIEKAKNIRTERKNE